MKLQQSFKKSLATVTMFILGVFAVAGLSYAAAPNLNAFKPINEGSDTQGRCVTEDTTEALNPKYMYSGDNKCILTSPLVTNGLIIKKPSTTFEIQGDPSYSSSIYSDVREWAKGALYVGCSANTKYSQSIRDGCGNTTLSNQPPAYLNGDVYIYELADSTATTDRRICISSTGEVKLCP